MFRLYHDEDAQRRALVVALQRIGFDCLTANEAGMRSQTDENHLMFASNEGRVLFTMNTADFRRLDAAWQRADRHHAGIIVLTNQLAPIGLQLRAFQTLADQFTPEQMVNRVEFLLNYART